MFDAATAISSVGETAAADRTTSHRYSGELLDGWDVMGNTHGGYMLAVAGRAMAADTQRPDPMTITAHYLSPGRPGPVTVDVETIKAGKRFTTARSTLSNAEGKAHITVLGTFGDLSDGGEFPTWIDGERPDVDPRSECVHMGEQDSAPAFMSHVNLLIDVRDLGFALGERTGEPRYRGWFSMKDAQPLTPEALMIAIDVFPPTIFNLDLPMGWAPTVELTGHLRARPVGDWLRCEVRTRYISTGFMEVDGTYWDEAGTLVAQSRQLALLPRG